MNLKLFAGRQFLIPVLLICFFLITCSTEHADMNTEFSQFLENYESKVIPVSKKSNLAYFQASVTGQDSLYKKSEKLQIELAKIYASKEDFAQLKKFRKAGGVTDPVLSRELELIYNNYLGNQLDPSKLQQIIQMQTAIEQKYSTFRSEFDGRKYTDNQIEDILRSSKDSGELEKAWKASKQVGQLVSGDILKLVAVRNEAARQLGYENYHTLQLKLSEQDPAEIDRLFDELDDLTRDDFISVKADIDRVLAKQYGINEKDLMPWHYQNRFFQEAPKIYKVDLDQFYKNQDIVEITRKYYDSIGLPIDDLIKNSDLYEREGKYQHAYCTDIDREGDIRVVGNVKPTYGWMNTMLHEFGHAVYDKFDDPSLPWTLRQPAHSFTTEAIAMMFGAFASNPAWLRDVLGIPSEQLDRVSDDCYKSLRLETLVFSRWAQVMYRFEKSMYADPGQDLNSLWWNLVEKYQMIKRPEGRNKPDWAAKIHIALYPAYYHNYLMGNILASQIYYTIGKKVLHTDNVTGQSFYNKKEVGEYLVKNVFAPGSLYPWNDMIERATGEKLTAKYYAMQYVQ
jgi:peptidyl-dipeptidase A